MNVQLANFNSNFIVVKRAKSDFQSDSFRHLKIKNVAKLNTMPSDGRGQLARGLLLVKERKTFD